MLIGSKRLGKGRFVVSPGRMSSVGRGEIGHGRRGKERNVVAPNLESSNRYCLLTSTLVIYGLST